MRLYEFANPEATVNSGELSALTQFLLARAEGEDATKTFSVDAFLKLANDMGISLTRDQLIAQAQQPPLSNLISNVEGNEIIFKGNDEDEAAAMSVDQARDTVDSMAKRAAKKKGI